MNDQTFDEYLQAIHDDIRDRDKDTIRLPNAILRFPGNLDSHICPGDDVMVQGWMGKALYTMDAMPGWWVVAKAGEPNRSVRESDVTVVRRCELRLKLVKGRLLKSNAVVDLSSLLR